MNETVVSVVCTNFNKGDWIGEAIESFLRQKTEFEFEILLIDDASTDHSVDIIRKYAKKHPNKIRAFYNKSNLGITKTWLKVCKEAKGKYIARCDGDDYWTDSKKLQNQVNLLEVTENTLWCSTDYDVISPQGKVTHRASIRSGYIPRPESYAEMLVTKGFTMSSTWLVDRKLLEEINAGLDADAIDDTFNIQLDLFNYTKLAYLPEVTTAYRVNEGSDSHPEDIATVILRKKQLLKTQLEYIAKYKDVDYTKIIKALLHRDMEHEILVIKQQQFRKEQQQHINNQGALIQELEEHLRNITESKSYIWALKMQKIVNIPRSIINRKAN